MEIERAISFDKVLDYHYGTLSLSHFYLRLLPRPGVVKKRRIGGVPLIGVRKKIEQFDGVSTPPSHERYLAGNK